MSNKIIAIPPQLDIRGHKIHYIADTHTHHLIHADKTTFAKRHANIAIIKKFQKSKDQFFLDDCPYYYT